jgi:hypothetical protein
MKPSKNLVVSVLSAVTVFGLALQTFADAKVNPYLSIVDRNPFGLKDPPPPPDPTPIAPVIPPAKVILTGITSLFGPTSKRALLEITEQEPGKPANTRKPVLREGEREGAIEIVSINVEKNVVHIRNGGQEVELKFEDASKTAATTPHAAPGVSPVAPTYTPPPPLSSGPTIISPSSAENSPRNGSVSMYGGQSVTGQGTAGMNMAAAIPTSLGSSAGYSGANLSRDLRGGQPEKVDPLHTEKQYVNMMVQDQVGQQLPGGVPPLPPPPDIDALREQRRQRQLQQQQQGFPNPR